jgi:N-acetylglucosamine kinase-like BadF-type ATPase
LLDGNRNISGQCQTSGLNPFYQTGEEIIDILKKEFTLQMPALSALFFYGAGCANAEKNEIVRAALHQLWSPDQISVDSDLMCAAHSLCGHSEGIAAILGTGSNSCYYDGQSIVNHVPPLGFILGDEGSGGVIGKKFVSDVLKKQLPASVCQQFFDAYGLTTAEILDRVYRQPFPNRFMARFTRFIYDHLEEESLYNLVKSSFVEFFERNVSQYKAASRLPVNFTGSIAWYFKPVLEDAAGSQGFSVGKVTKDPIEGLIDYHTGF